MSNVVEEAIASVQKAEGAFCKFISANDVGKTGGHQYGFYIPVSFCDIIFETPIQKRNDYVQFAEIKWQNSFTLTSRFKFYGSKNECHLTRFGRNFPFQTEDNLGNLLVVSKLSKDTYEAFVLCTDSEFEEFFAALNITANDTNRPIQKVEKVNAEDELLKCFYAYVKGLNKIFPPTVDLSENARRCFNSCYDVSTNSVRANPDHSILNWLDAEYQLFKAIETDVYSEVVKTPFENIENLIIFANTLLNRRKSRAGKSLEYHLATVFDCFDLKYTPQAITEDNKKPDFIFPSQHHYHDMRYDANKLVFLASKTTCKDRWRQIINEADRIEIKHLFTLQQGISKNQLNEMYNEGVRLVVPKPYLKSFPKDYHDKIYTLDNFINSTILTQA